MDEKQQLLEQHQQSIEVGSEILLIQSSSLTEDIKHQKFNSGTVLTHGKEELPFIWYENNKPSSSHHHLNHPESTRWIESQRIRSRSLVNEKTTTALVMNCDKDSQENILYLEKNENNVDTNSHSNDKITRIQCPERSATLPRRHKRKAYSGYVTGNLLPPHRVTPDGTAIYYWCELPRFSGSQGKRPFDQSYQFLSLLFTRIQNSNGSFLLCEIHVLFIKSLLTYNN
jgi:hypothetical protein